MQKLVVVTPKGHPLSYESAVDLRQVAEYPQIFYTPNSGLRPVVDRMFEQAKLQPEIAYEIEEDGSMAGLVAQNFGIALTPQIQNSLHTVSDSVLSGRPYKQYDVKKYHLDVIDEAENDPVHLCRQQEQFFKS